mmetsp:Transcript_26790/g.53513  ORF Transcript_26790/g.53513 Transcript_26790/m.53513 type:complete len:686 (+) Transcript_26790:157-2214(+)
MNNEPSSVANEATSDAAAAVDNNAGAAFDNVAPVPLETELDDPAAIHNSSLRNRRSSGSGSGSANGTNGNNGALATNNTKMKHQGSQLSLPKKKSSVFGASSNLVNSIVGAGIIGIPYALRMSGLWAGLFLLLLVGLFTDKSLRILIEQASFHPRFRSLPAPVLTFEDLASYPFGKFGSGFVLFNMFVMAYGAMVAYLLIIKDTVPTVMGYEHGTHLLERNFILILVSLLVMLPLSMQRDMASLSITSTISVAADVVLVVFVAAYSPIQDTVATNGGIGRIMQTDSVHSTLFVGLGILSTAMACQHSAFIVANSLNDKTRRRWKWVTNQSIALAAVLCAILGVCGYLGFLDDTQGDVLNNFPVGSVEADGARILLALTMVFTYPMESFVARHVLIMLVHNGDMDARGGFTPENESKLADEELGDDDYGHGNGAGDDDDDDDNATAATSRTAASTVVEGGGVFCLNRRQTWTISVYLMSLLPSLLVSDIGPVLSLTGAIGGSCISYIGPGLLYLGINGEEFLSKISGAIESWRRNKGYATSSSGANVNNNGSDRGSVTADDLPVEGDADAQLPPQNDVSPTARSYESIHTGPKPCWYYLGLFPFWCAIARKGAIHTNKKIDAAVAAFGRGGVATTPDDGAVDVLPTPSKWDFTVSIIFVLFGVVSLIAGVGSNIYVQLNGMGAVGV